MAEAAPAGEPRHHRIAGYEILGKIGEGGMGVVFKARQLSLGRVVALKVLPARLTRDTRFVERFLREARAIAKLSHPHIIRIFEVDRSKGGIYYYAMEYVDGESLGKRLKREGRLGTAESCRVAAQVARALDHAHAQGFVHRDVKPDNILLDASGNAKLADLGLARSLSEAVEREGSLTVGSVVGTPYYMSPEQAEGRPVDARSDIYALGATFYHLLTGAPPFVAESAVGVITKHLTDPRPDPRAANPEVPPAVARLVVRMMQVAPDARPATARAVAEELETLLGDSLTASLSGGGAPRLRRAFLVGAAGGVLLLVGGAFAFKAHRAATREAAAEDLLAQARRLEDRFRLSASVAEMTVALEAYIARLSEVADRFPATGAAETARREREEARGVLASLQQDAARQALRAEKKRLDAAVDHRFFDREALQTLRASHEALVRMAEDPAVPAAVRDDGRALLADAARRLSERFARPEEIAALRGMLLKRMPEEEARAFLVWLSEALPPDSPARGHVEREILVFEKRLRRAK